MTLFLLSTYEILNRLLSIYFLPLGFGILLRAIPLAILRDPEL